MARARAAADALEASYGATRGEKREPRDTPPVHRAEGRVLLELRLARNAFARARRRRDTAIPALVPGRGTRAVLASSRTRAAAEAPAPPPRDGDGAAPAPPPDAAPKRTTRAKRSRRGR